MATTDKKPEQTGPQVDPAVPEAAGTATSGEKPPESAENFEHTLRRLMVERSKEPHGG